MKKQEFSDYYDIFNEGGSRKQSIFDDLWEVIKTILMYALFFWKQIAGYILASVIIQRVHERLLHYLVGEKVLSVVHDPNMHTIELHYTDGSTELLFYENIPCADEVVKHIEGIPYKDYRIKLSWDQGFFEWHYNLIKFVCKNIYYGFIFDDKLLGIVQADNDTVIMVFVSGLVFFKDNYKEKTIPHGVVMGNMEDFKEYLLKHKSSELPVKECNGSCCKESTKCCSKESTECCSKESTECCSKESTECCSKESTKCCSKESTECCSKECNNSCEHSPEDCPNSCEVNEELSENISESNVDDGNADNNGGNEIL